MMNDWEGLLAVKEESGLWALHFDVDGESTSTASLQSCTPGF